YHQSRECEDEPDKEQGGRRRTDVSDCDGCPVEADQRHAAQLNAPDGGNERYACVHRCGPTPHVVRFDRPDRQELDHREQGYDGRLIHGFYPAERISADRHVHHSSNPPRARSTAAEFKVSPHTRQGKPSPYANFWSGSRGGMAFIV